MLFSRETLQSTLDGLTVESAMCMIALAGNKTEFETLLNGLARNFGADIPGHARETIEAASKRWYAARKNRNVSYAHS